MNWRHAGTCASGSCGGGAAGVRAASAGCSFAATRQTPSGSPPRQRLFIQQIPSLDLLLSTSNTRLRGDFSGITFISICCLFFISGVRISRLFPRSRCLLAGEGRGPPSPAPAASPHTSASKPSKGGSRV